MSLIGVLEERNSLTSNATDLTSKEPKPENGAESGELEFVTLQAEKENIFERDYAQSSKDLDGTFFIEERKESEQFVTLEAEKQNIFESTCEPSESVRKNTISSVEESGKDESSVEEVKDRDDEFSDGLETPRRNSINKPVIEDVSSIIEDLTCENEEKVAEDSEKSVCQDGSEVVLVLQDSTLDTTPSKVIDESNLVTTSPKTSPVESDLNKTVNMEDAKDDSVVMVSSRETSFVQSISQLLLNKPENVEDMVATKSHVDVVELIPERIESQVEKMVAETDELNITTVIESQTIESRESPVQPDVDLTLERTESVVEKGVPETDDLNRTTVFESRATESQESSQVTQPAIDIRERTESQMETAVVESQANLNVTISEKTELLEEKANLNKEDTASSEEPSPVAASLLEATKGEISPSALSAALKRRLSRLINPQPYSPTQLILAAAFENLKINSPDETFLSCNDDSQDLINGEEVEENRPGEICNESDVEMVTLETEEVLPKVQNVYVNGTDLKTEVTPNEEKVSDEVIEISDDESIVIDLTRTSKSLPKLKKSRRSSGITMEPVTFAATPSPLKYDGHLVSSYSPSEHEEDIYEKYLQKKLEINHLKQTIAKLTLECKQREAEAMELQPQRVKVPMMKQKPQKPTSLVQTFKLADSETNLEKLYLENDELKKAVEAKTNEFTELQTKHYQSEENIASLKKSLVSADQIISDLHASLVQKDVVIKEVTYQFNAIKIGFNAHLEKYESVKAELEKMKIKQNTDLLYIEKLEIEKRELLEKNAVADKQLEVRQEPQQKSTAVKEVVKRRFLPKK